MVTLVTNDDDRLVRWRGIIRSYMMIILLIVLETEGMVMQ